MQGEWTAAEIAGKPAEVYEPAADKRPRFGVLQLHDARGESLRGRTAFTRIFDELGLVCVGPFAPHTWWSDRICPEFDPRMTAEQFVLDHVLPYFSSRWGLGPRT